MNVDDPSNSMMAPLHDNTGGGGTQKRKKRRNDEGLCSALFLRYVIMVFTILFLFSGMTIIGVGIWTLVDKSSYVSLLGSHIYYSVTLLLIISGCLILVFAIIGGVATLKQHRCCLLTYASFLFLIFLVEIATGGMSYIYEATVLDELKDSLFDTMSNGYLYDDAKTKAINQLQSKMQCCGAEFSNDWFRTKWYTQVGHNQTVPDSCCISISYECGKNIHPSNIYTTGCVARLAQLLRQHSVILGAVAVGICSLQIFGIIFSCCLARNLKRKETIKNRRTQGF